MFLAYLVACMVIGLIAERVAKEKGRSGLGWGVMGLFFGPLALLVCLLPPVEGVAVKVCPACAETVKMEAKICRYCGNDFDSDEYPQGYKPKQ